MIARLACVARGCAPAATVVLLWLPAWTIKAGGLRRAEARPHLVLIPGDVL